MLKAKKNKPKTPKLPHNAIANRKFINEVKTTNTQFTLHSLTRSAWCFKFQFISRLMFIFKS
jgi:hypothetical protein